MKIYLDPGHGGSDPGAIGHGIKEKDIVLDIALRIRSILTNNYEQFDVRMSRMSDLTKSLNQRTNDANSWGADYFISIHCNAFNGNPSGYEDYIYSGLNSSSITVDFRNRMHNEISKITGLLNRGKKKANFHVLRETKMPAFLSENGFIDNQMDAALMRDANWRERIALGHVNGILNAFNVTAKPATVIKKKVLYKVIAGSFQSKEKARERKAYLESKGIGVFIAPTSLSGTNYYRIQTGSFSNRQNAERYKDTVEKLGIKVTIIHS